MSVEPEAIARRYAIRAGCRFIGFKPVGLAVFSLSIRALVVESREIPPIDEFILRLMTQGVDTIASLSELLGLEESLIRRRLVELRRLECIEVAATGTTESDMTCFLTSRGEELTRTLQQSVMHEITIPNLIYHGLLRKPVEFGVSARRHYLNPKEAKEQGFTLVRAIPNRYPHADEISVDLVDKVLRSATRKSHLEPKREIVAVKSILRMVYTLYEPAVMLEYETIDERHERQVTFAVDGQLRDDYERAFGMARGTELQPDLLSPKSESLPARLEKIAPKHIIERLGRLDDVEELASKLAAATQDIEDACNDFENADRADTRQVLREKIDKLMREKSKIELERNARKVQHLWTPEIRKKFDEALRDAKERLLILSGFVSSEVVNTDLERQLRAALQRKVRIWIGYGFDKGKYQGTEQRARTSWKDAVAVFERLHREFPDLFTHKDVGRSHEKRLVCDNRFTFGGSFNLLSFSGKARGGQDLRHEGADLIEDPDYCEERYAHYLKLFFS